MALVFGNEGFEGGSNGTAVSTSNSTFGSIAGAGWTFSNTPLLATAGGSLAGKCAVTGATAVAQANFTGTNAVYTRLYVYISSLPSALFTFAQYGNGANVAQLRLGANAQLQLRNSGNTQILVTANNIVPTGAWCRIEWMYDGNAGKQQLRVYSTDPHGTTADYDSGLITSAVQTGTNNVKFGAIEAQTYTAFYDNIATDSATWVGSAAPPTAFSGSLGTSGSGALTASGTPRLTQAQGLSGSGALSLVSAPRLTQTLALSGSGALTLSGVKGAVANQYFGASSGVLAITPTPQLLGSLTASSTGGLVLSGVANYAGSLSLSGASELGLTGLGMAWLLVTPTQDFYYPLVERSHLYGNTPMGVNIFRIGGAWHTALALSPEQEATADRLYRGGYQYPLTDPERLDLIAGGFGSNITLEELS